MVVALLILGCADSGDSTAIVLEDGFGARLGDPHCFCGWLGAIDGEATIAISVREPPALWPCDPSLGDPVEIGPTETTVGLTLGSKLTVCRDSDGPTTAEVDAHYDSSASLEGTNVPSAACQEGVFTGVIRGAVFSIDGDDVELGDYAFDTQGWANCSLD